MELLFILYKSLIRLISSKAVKTCKIKHVTFFGKFKIFLERLKGCFQSKHNCVKTVNVRHDAKCYRVTQGTVGSWKMHFFRIISFLNDSKFYDEEQNKLSQHPLSNGIIILSRK